MYRYLIFGYDMFYPCGGMKDCLEKTNELSTVIDVWQKNVNEYSHLHVYDFKTGETYSDVESLMGS